MLRILTILSLAILSSYNAAASGNVKQSGARSSGLGTASVTLIDIWGAFNNQAALAYLKQPELAFYYENKFMIKEMGYKAAAFTYPTKLAVLTLSADYFGFSSFNESKIALACSKVISKHLSLGVQLDYLMFRQDKEYGNKNLVSIELGLLVKINDQLSFGTQVYNPVQSKLYSDNDDNKLSEIIPVIFRAGISYSVIKELSLLAEVQENINSSPIVKLGIEYVMNEKYYIRAGIMTNSSLSFGFGLPIGNLKFDISASYHQTLGFSPQASSGYMF